MPSSDAESLTPSQSLTKLHHLLSMHAPDYPIRDPDLLDTGTIGLVSNVIGHFASCIINHTLTKEETSYLDAGFRHELTTPNEIAGAEYLRKRTHDFLETLSNVKELKLSELDTVVGVLYFIRYLEKTYNEPRFLDYAEVDSILVVSIMVAYKYMNEEHQSHGVTPLFCRLLSVSSVLLSSEATFLQKLDFRLNVQDSELLRLVEIIRSFPCSSAASHLQN